MRRCGFLTLLTLVWVAAPAALAHAQGDVVIDVQGVAAGVPVGIFMSSASADRTIAGASGSVVSSFMSEGKSADVFIERCRDKVSVSIIEEGRLPPPEDADCERTTERVQWAPGMRLVIDGARGVLVRTPTTIGTRPEIQSAVRAVLDALGAEPPAGVATGATRAALMELATISDTALGAWIPRFRDRFADMGRQGANNSTLAAMEQLLTAVVPQYALRTSSPGAGAASTAAAPATGAREFNFTASAQYVRDRREIRNGPSAPTSAASPLTFSGRFWTPGGPIARNRTWFYSVATGRSIGLSEATGAANDSVVFADPEWEDWIEIREPSVMDRQPFVGGGSPPLFRRRSDRAMASLAGLVTAILPNFVQRGLMFRRGPAALPPAVPFTGSPVQQTDQGQASVATPPPDSNQKGSLARPPQLLLAARSFLEAVRQSFVPTVRHRAYTAPGVRLAIGPGGRREYWIEPMPSGVAPGQAAPDIPRPSMKVFIRSLGRSTGENAQEAIIINDGNVPVRVLEGEAFATEPLAGVSEQSLAKEIEKYAGRPRVTMNLTSYCLNFEKAAPTKGRVYRVAARTAQEQLEPVRRILQAAERVRDDGELRPDGDPNLYFHSVRQWAIWTVEQRFNDRTFAEALLEYTKKNVVAAGRRWNREIESAARSIIPNRWRDVQRVLAEAQP